LYSVIEQKNIYFTNLKNLKLKEEKEEAVKEVAKEVAKEVVKEDIKEVVVKPEVAKPEVVKPDAETKEPTKELSPIKEETKKQTKEENNEEVIDTRVKPTEKPKETKVNIAINNDNTEAQVTEKEQLLDNKNLRVSIVTRNNRADSDKNIIRVTEGKESPGKDVYNVKDNKDNTNNTNDVIANQTINETEHEEENKTVHEIVKTKYPQLKDFFKRGFYNKLYD